MFSELPKLFDRNFATSFFLPSALAIALSLGLVDRFGLSANLLPLAGADILIGTTVIGLLSWLGGVLLLAANRDIIRMIEGYGRCNPARLFAWREERRFKRLREAISKADNEYASYASSGQELPPELRLRRARLMLEAAERFPDQEIWLLPTAFGNTIRAFEVYPRVMYGLESIQGWSRLFQVIPEDYRKYVDTAKAQVDFWANLWALSLLMILQYLGVVIYTEQLSEVWIPVVGILVAWMAVTRARSAAVEWGDAVKASFDLFLPELREEIDLPPVESRSEERGLWSRYSQAIIYRSPSSLPGAGGSQPEQNQGHSFNSKRKRRRCRPRFTGIIAMTLFTTGALIVHIISSAKNRDKDRS